LSRDGFGYSTAQVAAQQLPPPTTTVAPGGALAGTAHFEASDFVEHRRSTAAHSLLSVHGVTPSSHRPLLHVPGLHSEQVTKPLFLPHVERAAQRTTLPLQFTSRSPLDTASFTLWATHLTCWP